MKLRQGMRVVPVLLIVCALSAHARADEPSTISKQERPHLAVETQLGVGMPTGYLGVAADVSLNERFAISAGVGAGQSGTQVALMGRYRFHVRDTWNVDVGGGVSFGRYKWIELVFDEPAEKLWDRAFWGNAEIGLERPFGDGFHFRLFAGVGTIVNRDDGVCVGTSVTHCETDHRGDGFTMPYAGFAIGWGWLL